MMVAQDFGESDRLDLFLPKFKVDSSLSLVAALEGLGVREAFDDTNANFSRLSEDPTFISDVLHKVRLRFTYGTCAVPVLLPMRRLRTRGLAHCPHFWCLQSRRCRCL